MTSTELGRIVMKMKVIRAPSMGGNVARIHHTILHNREINEPSSEAWHTVDSVT
jgi:hypothetical protein